MRKGIFTFLVFALAVSLVNPAFSQDSKDETQGLRMEVIRLKYIKAEVAQGLLYPFFGHGGFIQSHPMLPDVITVKGKPENIEEILAALKKIDVKPADVLFTVQLVLGSETEEKTDPELQNDPLVKELRNLLRYKGYTLLDTTLLRSVDGLRSEVILGEKADFELQVRPEVAQEPTPATIKVEISLSHSKPELIKNAEGKEVTSYTYRELIKSNLNVRSGEKTVVGVSRLDGGDKGLILIVSGKVVD